jgi:hypothetical protein
MIRPGKLNEARNSAALTRRSRSNSESGPAMGAPAPATERSGRRYYDMSIAHRHDLDIEATLDDLYANEMNVAISWNHERGFHAALGNPALAEGSFPTSGEAVRWLKEQALHHFFSARRVPARPKSPARSGSRSSIVCAQATSPVRFPGPGMAASTRRSASRSGPRNGRQPAPAKPSRGCASRRPFSIPAANSLATMPALAFCLSPDLRAPIAEMARTADRTPCAGTQSGLRHGFRSHPAGGCPRPSFGTACPSGRRRRRRQDPTSGPVAR